MDVAVPRPVASLLKLNFFTIDVEAHGTGDVKVHKYNYALRFELVVVRPYIASNLSKKPKDVGRAAGACKPLFAMRRIFIARCQLIHVRKLLAVERHCG
jgi:hypothetical protein